MKYTQKTRIISIICVIAIATASLFALLGTAFAAVNWPNSINEPLDLTNRYEGYTSLGIDGWYNDNVHVSQNPMITVLTHGMGGDAHNVAVYSKII